MSPTSLFVKTWRSVNAHIKPVVSFGIVFHVVMILLLTPLQGLLLKALGRWNGSAAVLNFDIVAFALSVPGLLWGTAFLATWFGLLLVQQTGFLLLAESAKQSRPFGVVDLIRQTLRCLPRLLSMTLTQAMVLLAAMTVFIAGLAGVNWHVVSTVDLGTLLTSFPVLSWPGLVSSILLSIGFLAVLFSFFVSWSVAFPICILEDKWWSAPLREGWNSSQGTRWKIACAFFYWFSLTLVCLIAVGAILVIGAETVIKALPQDPPLVAITTGVLLVVVGLSLAVVRLFGIAGYAFLAHRIYNEQGRSSALRSAALPSQSREKTRTGIWKTTASCAALVALSLGSTFALLETLNLEHAVKITAHRGSSARAPENTLAAFRAAIEDGADFIELDVQLTSDGTIVVFHDFEMTRLTGKPGLVRQTSHTEIASRDAGSVFGEQFSNEKIPTLQQVIDLVGKRARLNIELKVDRRDRELAEAVVALLKKNDLGASSVVSSLNYETLQDIRALDSKLRIGQIVTAKIGDITKLNIDFVSIAHQWTTTEFVKTARARSLEVHVWTVNDIDLMNKMINLGVDNIITDVPAQVSALVSQRAKMTDTERLLLSAGSALRSN